MSGERILFVDDETNIIQLARLYLEREGYQVAEAGDGKTALEMAAQIQPGLVVLDVMIPEPDGFEVCRTLRAQGNEVPILMLTARDDDLDKILGLELGADDYMTKPFNPRELVARVKAILRRSERVQDAPAEDRIVVGDLTILPDQHEVYVAGRKIDLRTQEFEVLMVLARSPGQVYSREKLLELAWGYEFYGQTRTVDVHIAQIRRKMGTSLTRIETVTGIGYKLAV